MNSKTAKQSKIIYLLMAVLAASVVFMIVALCTDKGPTVGEFVPPAFESAAVQGVPQVDESLGYTELYRDGMAYRVWICGIVTMDAGDAIVNFTNVAENTKYLKLRVTNESGEILGETGLLKPGEYVERVMLTSTPSVGTKLKLKIMGYEPQDYTSAGAVTLNVMVQ